MEEMLVVILGPLAVFVVFAFCVILTWLCQVIMGIFPDLGSKFVLMIGIQSILNPLLLIIVDLIQGVS